MKGLIAILLLNSLLVCQLSSESSLDHSDRVYLGNFDKINENIHILKREKMKFEKHRKKINELLSFFHEISSLDMKSINRDLVFKYITEEYIES
jgi:hypothetical protein